MVNAGIDLTIPLILSVLVVPTNSEAPPPTNTSGHNKGIGGTSVRQGMFLD